MRYGSIFFLMIFCCFTYAAIFMHEDEAGNVTYSDSPFAKGKAIIVPKSDPSASVTSTSPTNTSTAATPTMLAPTKASVATVYETFLIKSPLDNETIQNAPQFTVTFEIKPALKENDRLLLNIDGRPWGQPQHVKEIVVKELSRGEHQVNAVILDSRNQVLKQSKTITIFIQKIGVNFPTRR